jgi:multiple sugar transport system permease protein
MDLIDATFWYIVILLKELTMFEWLGSAIFDITRLHVFVLVAAIALAWIAWRRSRSPMVWFAVAMVSFIAVSVSMDLLLPDSTLEPGEEPSAAYRLWSDPAFRSDTGLLLIIIGLSIILVFGVKRLLHVATPQHMLDPDERTTPPQWQRWLSVLCSALVLIFPLVIWTWLAGILIGPAGYGELITSLGGFVVIMVFTGVVATGLEDERRKQALLGLAAVLIAAQLRYNATRPPPVSYFDPPGTVPFFLVLFPYLFGLIGANIMKQARTTGAYILGGWRLGALAWTITAIGFAVKFMGYYDYQTTYAFDLGAVFGSPIRFLAALAQPYYDVVPREIAAEQNVAAMNNWHTALTALAGVLVLGAVWVQLRGRLPIPDKKRTLQDYITRFEQVNLTLQQKRYLLAFVLITPAVALRTFTTFYPFMQTIVLSVQRYNPAFPPRRYIDMRNFEKLSTDLVVRESLEFTLIFVFVSTFFQVVLGLAIAHLLNAQFRLRGIARTISLIPWAIPMVVAAIGFRWMFDDQFGMIPDLLRRIGYEGKWLVNPENAKAAVTFVNIWKSTPFAALLLLAGLQGINEDLYEAARVDGANWIHALRYITIPMLMPILVTVSMFLLVWQLAVFDLPFAMTGGGPGFSTTVLSQKIYLEINSLNYSFAAAVSIFLVLVVSIIGGMGLYLLRRSEVQA